MAQPEERRGAVGRVVAGHPILPLMAWLAMFARDGHQPASREPEADR
jgi:hypothetical protein